VAQGVWKKTEIIINAAHAVLSIEQPMTLRQLFYRLVSTETIANSKADYQSLSRVMSRARERGEIPFEWITDRSRPEYSPNVFEDMGDYFRTVSHAYRRDLWIDQPSNVEIWTEKDALTGSIEGVARELGVPMRVGRGFVSVTRANEIAQRFAKLNTEGKDIHVFYLGDHDPSGLCIEDQVRDRVREYRSGPFTMQRLAIHAADIRNFNLPPLKIKQADTRASAFRRKHGEKCVEVDALPPTELRRRITEAVHSVVDVDRWNRAINVEKIEHDSIASIVSAWPSAQAQL
jgi:hypothetical protein